MLAKPILRKIHITAVTVTRIDAFSISGHLSLRYL